MNGVIGISSVAVVGVIIIASLVFVTVSPKQEVLSEVIVEPIFSERQISNLIHSEINQIRMDNGLQPLEYDFELEEIARQHSEDMALRNYFAHESPEGNTIEQRYADNEYVCHIVTRDFIGMGGENLSQNWKQGDNNYVALSTVQGWMESPGHRENILIDYFENQGIGVYLDSDDEIYITQNFC